MDRVTVPLYGFLDHLFSSGSIFSVLENLQSSFTFDKLRHMKLVTKLRGSVYVLCHLFRLVSADHPAWLSSNALPFLILRFWNDESSHMSVCSCDHHISINLPSGQFLLSFLTEGLYAFLISSFVCYRSCPLYFT